MNKRSAVRAVAVAIVVGLAGLLVLQVYGDPGTEKQTRVPHPWDSDSHIEEWICGFEPSHIELRRFEDSGVFSGLELWFVRRGKTIHHAWGTRNGLAFSVVLTDSEHLISVTPDGVATYFPTNEAGELMEPVATWSSCRQLR